MRGLLLLGLTGLAILARHWKRLALVDPITRSGNSLALERFLRSRRRRVFVGSLFLLDIDGFAEINNAFSYAAGDRILSEVVACLAYHLGESARVFRYKYGDEFLGVVEAETQIDGERIKQRFLNRLAQKSFFLAGHNRKINISVSVGHLFVDHERLDQTTFDYLERNLREAKGGETRVRSKHITFG